MSEFFRSRTRAFGYAFTGFWFVLRTQRNAWIHALASMAVFLLCLWLHLSLRDWAIIVVAVTLVWLAEFINTALEAVVDLASPQQHYLAKMGKDIGAAAVLIAAISSILIGLLILGPPLLEKLQGIFQGPL